MDLGWSQGPPYIQFWSQGPATIHFWSQGPANIHFWSQGPATIHFWFWLLALGSKVFGSRPLGSKCVVDGHWDPRCMMTIPFVQNVCLRGCFVSISSLTGECAAEKNKNFCSSSLWTCLHHMVILRSQNKITDFIMILAWASPFKASHTPQRFPAIA